MALQFLAKPIICPYCFNKFKPRDIQWRCTSYSCGQKPEPDPAFEQYHPSANPLQPHILVDAKAKKGFANCEVCHEDTNNRICPECHSSLPDSKENIIISIIGAPGAGKSYYVGALLRQLNLHIHKFNCSFSYTTQKDQKLYDTKFGKPFTDGTPVSKTQIPTANSKNNFIGANTPILCDLQDQKLDTRTFTFFDAAGENFNDPVMMNAVSKYLQHSEALLLLLDPEEILAVSAALPGGGKKGSTISYDNILLNIVSTLRLQMNKSKDTLLDIPIAIAFSKWDLIENTEGLRHPDSIISLDSPHFTDGFSAADCDNVSLEVQSRLEEWHYANFLQLVAKNFKNYKFFAFSAIGSTPKGNGKMPPIVSKRVEDPFLWLLNERKIIVK